MATITRALFLSLSLSVAKNALLARVPFRGTAKARPFREIFNGKAVLINPAKVWLKREAFLRSLNIVANEVSNLRNETRSSSKFPFSLDSMNHSFVSYIPYLYSDWKYLNFNYARFSIFIDFKEEENDSNDFLLRSFKSITMLHVVTSEKKYLIQSKKKFFRLFLPS